MLTAKQHALLMFIHESIKESGVSPSFEEMKAALDLKSKSGIHRLITALEERGFIRRLAHKARALEVVKLPETATVPGGTEEPPAEIGFVPHVIENPSPPSLAAQEGMTELPILGKIAAGTPIAAIQHEQMRVPIPQAMMRSGEHFALTVEGDSMVDAGIHDGDTVVIQRCDDAANGEIIVALVDDEEATLKRIRKKGGSIALEAENPAYETRIFGPNRVKVQGRLTGLLRAY
ncbi:MAG: transcriptional repressor LexA [Pseudomonadota bacterium]